MEATQTEKPTKKLYHVVVTQTAHAYIAAESEREARHVAWRDVDDFEDTWTDVSPVDPARLAKYERDEPIFGEDDATVGEWLDFGGDIARGREEQAKKLQAEIEAWFAAIPDDASGLIAWHLKRPSSASFHDYLDTVRWYSGEVDGSAILSDGHGGAVVAGASVEAIGSTSMERVRGALLDGLPHAAETTREKIRAWLDARAPSLNTYGKQIEAVRIREAHLDASLVRTWVWSAARLCDGPIKVEHGGALDMVRFACGDVTACVMPLRPGGKNGAPDLETA